MAKLKAVLGAVDVGDVAGAVGLGVTCWGIAMVSLPAALIVLGMPLMGLAGWRWWRTPPRREPR